jgi:hypothetical protein
MSKSERRKIISVSEIDEDFLFVRLSDDAVPFVGLDRIELGYRKEDTAVAVRIDNQQLTVILYDGRSVSTPLAWYPALKGLTEEQLNDFELFPTGPYWKEINQRITVESMLLGRKS